MRIGIDLGGTKIEGIAIDGSNELLRRRVRTPRDDYPATIRQISALVAGIETELGRSGTVGVGIPGAVSAATGLIKNANSTWLIGQPLDRDLARALKRPVRVANDANCFALSEATDGAGEHAEVVFGAILGTGTGGGIVVNGHLIEGRNRIAGEWGHNPLPWPGEHEHSGRSCYCGRTDCIETFLSGPGLSITYASIGGQQIEASDIAARAGSGDRLAARALDLYEGQLARALASIINVLDPDVIVLGGGLSNIGRLYTNVPALWQPYVFSDAADTPLVPARHGDSSGVRGAAWLWRDTDEGSN
ncbi:MAG TPA: ROK family protein [Vicinamibacterales bacterium]|nr:ROK family protein [Vicinamibacterales bacterium]